MKKYLICFIIFVVAVVFANQGISFATKVNTSKFVVKNSYPDNMDYRDLIFDFSDEDFSKVVVPQRYQKKNNLFMKGAVSLIIFSIFFSLYGIAFYIVARKKGYTGFKTVFLCFCPIINIFCGWIYLCLPDLIVRDMIRAISSDKLKKCPFCAESILKEAIVCKHCNRDLLGAT